MKQNAREYWELPNVICKKSNKYYFKLKSCEYNHRHIALNQNFEWFEKYG